MSTSPATLHFFCGKAGAGKSRLAARPARIAKRNVELPEGSHPLTEEVFRHVTSLFEPPVEPGLDIQVHAQSVRGGES